MAWRGIVRFVLWSRLHSNLTSAMVALSITGSSLLNNEIRNQSLVITKLKTRTIYTVNTLWIVNVTTYFNWFQTNDETSLIFESPVSTLHLNEPNFELTSDSFIVTDDQVWASCWSRWAASPGVWRRRTHRRAGPCSAWGRCCRRRRRWPSRGSAAPAATAAAAASAAASAASAPSPAGVFWRAFRPLTAGRTIRTRPWCTPSSSTGHRRPPIRSVFVTECFFFVCQFRNTNSIYNPRVVVFFFCFS